MVLNQFRLKAIQFINSANLCHICISKNRRRSSGKMDNNEKFKTAHVKNTQNYTKTQKFYRLKENSDNCDIIESVVKILQKGGVIALPTDTLYGIACLAQSTEAIEKVYQIKGRNLSKPIAICVGDVYDVFHWGKIPQAADCVQEKTSKISKWPVERVSALFPGPVTIVTERTPALNTRLNPDTNLVGIRIPDFQFIRDLTNRLKEPLALTSANLSSALSPLSVDDFEDLHDKLDAVIDGGHLGLLNGAKTSREGSTVVQLLPDGKHFKILRSGCALKPTTDILRTKWGLELLS